jgi:hypothetical protein
VAVHVEGSLEGLAHGADRSVTIVVTVDDPVDPGVDVAVNLDRAGLPEEVSIQTLKTASLRRAGEVRVPVKFRVAPEAQAGTWRPRVSLEAEEGVVVDPATVDLTVAVPEHSVVVAAVVEPSAAKRSLWGVFALVALALTAAASLYVGRSKDDLLLQVNG